MTKHTAPSDPTANAGTLQQATSTGTPTGAQWREQWVNPASIIRDPGMQVRGRLDPAALKRYAERTEAGHEPPPIMVGRCTATGALYLVDGWHRWEAGALVRNAVDEVRALVADLTVNDIRWEAAAANGNHGVPLRPADYRRVLTAFIRAGKHRLPRGGLMSYRDMAAVIGKGHTTIRNWIKKDHPRLFQRIGGSEGGNPHAGPATPDAPPSEADRHCAAALEAVEVVVSRLPAMEPAQRGRLAEHLREALRAAERLGVELAPY